MSRRWCQSPATFGTPPMQANRAWYHLAILVGQCQRITIDLPDRYPVPAEGDDIDYEDSSEVGADPVRMDIPDTLARAMMAVPSDLRMAIVAEMIDELPPEKVNRLVKKLLETG